MGRMTRPKQRRLHLPIEPEVTFQIEGLRVSFVGLNLLNRAVMVEYDVDPPLQRDRPFGPHLLQLRVTDDLSDESYPTIWEDFPWPTVAPLRVTTRLDRRPDPAARRLSITVFRTEPASLRPGTWDFISGPELGVFEVELPPEHGLPWRAPPS
jgi:hypothetical protein